MSLEFDHGTMVPLHFLVPRMDRPVVPILCQHACGTAAERAVLPRTRAA